MNDEKNEPAAARIQKKGGGKNRDIEGQISQAEMQVQNGQATRGRSDLGPVGGNGGAPIVWGNTTGIGFRNKRS